MRTFWELPEYSAILTLLDSVLAEINVGLVIFHAPEDVDDPSRLKLIYANDEASRCTGADLTRRIGRTIVEAFPPLAHSEIPAIYLEVARGGKARRLGPVHYGDNEVAPRMYEVKAFPMPMHCVGILFEEASVSST